VAVFAGVRQSMLESRDKSLPTIESYRVWLRERISLFHCEAIPCLGWVLGYDQTFHYGQSDVGL